MPKTFVLSTSEVNSYGFRVLTEGIELPKSKDLTMLWGHLRGEAGKKDDVLPIGKWVNLRVEGDRLLAEPEFDMDDTFAAEIARKVEKGYISEASAGLMPRQWSAEKNLMLKGQTLATLTKSRLREASITVVASNESAIALFSDDGQAINLNDPQALVQLTSTGKITSIPTNMEDLKLVALALGLTDNADQRKVLASIQELKAKAGNLENEINLLKEKEADARKVEIVNLLDAAVTDNRITAAQRPVYANLFAADFDNTKAALDSLPKIVKMSEVPAGQTGGDGKFTYQGKTFSQLRKDAPDVLQTLKANDFSTFNQLYKAEYGKNYKVGAE
jgi:hypothetical protein